jgi:hypothetical protein
MIIPRSHSSRQVATALLEGAIPLLRCCTGLKNPHKNNDGTWDTCDNPDRLEGWLRPRDNLAVLLGQTKRSPLIGIGLDCYKTRRSWTGQRN